MVMSRKKLLIGSMLVASLFVSIAFYISFGMQNEATVAEVEIPQETVDKKLSQVRDITPEDHILGSPNAKLVFVVYSDFQCPYCKVFHETMRHIISVYGSDGDVAWVFRHIPLVELHRQAPMYALASECVADLRSEQAFWDFANTLYEAVDPKEDPPTTSDLVNMAVDLGVDRTAFVQCMKTNKTLKKVQTDYEEAIASGATGSPYTIVFTPHQRFVIDGVRSYKSLAGAIIASLDALEKDAQENFGTSDGSSAVSGKKNGALHGTSFENYTDGTDTTAGESIVPRIPES